MDQKALTEAYLAAEKALLESQRTDLIYGVREGAPPIAPWPTAPCKVDEWTKDVNAGRIPQFGANLIY